jgi:hypothetical protein
VKHYYVVPTKLSTNFVFISVGSIKILISLSDYDNLLPNSSNFISVDVTCMMSIGSSLGG